MSTVANRSRRGRKVYAVQKPHGVIAPRIQAVGPEHFGIVACDCAKARFKLMLADFYGKVHIPPAEFAVTAPGLRSAIEAVRLALERHRIRDSVVAIERTGEYHRPVAQAMQQAGFEVRFVHPHTTKQMRQPSDPGNKTDETDLAAIFRPPATASDSAIRRSRRCIPKVVCSFDIAATSSSKPANSARRFRRFSTPSCPATPPASTTSGGTRTL
jgi:hypothetical protein